MASFEKAVHVIISGRVQGVWFRAWTQQQASALALSGFVRNLRDGRVEAVFCGSAVAVDDMLARCAHGPQAARVEEVQVQETPADALEEICRQAGGAFRIHPTK